MGAHFVNAWLGFAVGMAGWFFILFEIFVGEAGKVAASGDKVNEHVKASFATMRFIVTVGWSIYPLGYFFGDLLGQVDDSALNLVYNLADFVNKIAFCLAIWQSAKRDTSERGTGSLLAGAFEFFVLISFVRLSKTENFLPVSLASV